VLFINLQCPALVKYVIAAHRTMCGREDRMMMMLMYGRRGFAAAAAVIINPSERCSKNSFAPPPRRSCSHLSLLVWPPQ